LKEKPYSTNVLTKFAAENFIGEFVSRAFIGELLSQDVLVKLAILPEEHISIQIGFNWQRRLGSGT